jgi:hypothetical protein
MKVELTGKRSKDNCVLFDVVFTKGKAELNASEVSADVYARLLNRYHGVIKSGDKEYVNEKELQEAEADKALKQYYADSQAKALNSPSSNERENVDTTTPIIKPKAKKKANKKVKAKV